MSSLAGSLSTIDASTRSVEVVASTPAPVDGESLVSWDLARFAKNPVVLWSHQNEILPVAQAEDVRIDDAGLLKMRLRFASREANPMAEQVFRLIQEGVLRGVSVGFRPGALVDGKRRANELTEVSVVNVPADENAGTSALNPAAETEEERRARISAAAATLATSRLRADATRLDARDVLRMDSGGRLAKAKRNSAGAAYVPARITRTGVLTYRLPGGKERREYRPADEVFKADSLATLEDVPVVDIVDHSRLYQPDDWRRASRGYVKAFRRDGKFVAADLVVQDVETLDALDRGDRTEISCGYVCRLDFTPGTSPDGEPYDCVQRDIRYNHVALCPPNGGRAGNEVAVTLDQNEGAPEWGVAIIDEAIMTTKIHLDGATYDFGSEAHIAKITAMNEGAVNDLQTKLDASEKERGALQGKLDAAKKSLEDAEKAKEEEAAKGDDERKRSASGVKARLRKLLRSLVLREMGSDDNEDEKFDSVVDAAFDEKAAEAFMVDFIKKSDPDFKADGELPPGYIEGRFDAVSEAAVKSRGVDGVLRAVSRETSRLDSSRSDRIKAIEDAKRKRDEAAMKAHETKSR